MDLSLVVSTCNLSLSFTLLRSLFLLPVHLHSSVSLLSLHVCHPSSVNLTLLHTSLTSSLPPSLSVCAVVGGWVGGCPLSLLTTSLLTSMAFFSGYSATHRDRPSQGKTRPAVNPEVDPQGAGGGLGL